MARPVTSDERYKGARGSGKGCNCYRRGRESPRLDSKIRFEWIFEEKLKYELFPGSLLCYYNV